MTESSEAARGGADQVGEREEISGRAGIDAVTTSGEGVAGAHTDAREEPGADGHGASATGSAPTGAPASADLATPPAAAADPTTDVAPDAQWPDWEKRFRAARVGLPDWAEGAPERSLFVSNATGTYELYAWDRATGEQRQVTDRPNGTTDGVLSPDGQWIWWFSDNDGDEFGVWLRQPFTGGHDEPAVPKLAASYPAGLALGLDGTAVIGRSTDEEGSVIHVVRAADLVTHTGGTPGHPSAAGSADSAAGAGAGPEPVEIYRHRQSAGVGDLSHDAHLLAIEHTEHGDAMHSAIRVVRLDGTTVAELDDTKGGEEELGLSVLGFVPVDGDARLLVGHQRRGRWEPMIWNPLTGEERALTIDLPGDVGAEWYPDGGALLIDHSYQARSELWRYELADGALTRVETPKGTISGATARPDGSVEFLWSSAQRPPQVRSTTGRVVLEPPSLPGGLAQAPDSVPVTDAWVDSPGGRVHALVQRPQGEGPFPTVFDIHGGPTWHDSDAFASGPAAWVDHGYAVVRVNYRGSTGYGRAWTDALKHRVGLIELEDIAAVREWAVSCGLADPQRLVLSGGSWGGYLTLLGLGTQPDAWAAGLAAVPVADYVTAYHDEMEALKAMDRTLLGGTPEEVPERFAASSPLTYVDQVRAPVYISAGVNDPRCPIRQVENYVTRLERRGVPHEVYRYDAGHGSLVVEERIKQLRMEIAFVQRHLRPADRSSEAADNDGPHHDRTATGPAEPRTPQ
ncbi:S9 family peptidase [Streptomyces zagrosensis]|uniref:Dipeptidyl aminopeptidase/acylaminoacyl peptidase n=1 Tax=Streptomyces zagrosensis TaxID=1042984 RepID=A0A7W9Q673_9ACTN|nr:prolyl oligopeptidase family serine peptidase [Streptomyces zagrosensis]MBB5934369.1 dipeptidyl aminopeptidase/acylaminoacyl peptidase [Streptomyces zagrosensis]